MKIEKFPLKARAKCAYCDSTVYGYVQYVDELVEGYVWFKTLEGALVMVKEDTVCAFTGAEDDLGVDVYEGDVIQIEGAIDNEPFTENFLIAFIQQQGAFCAFDEKGRADEVGLYNFFYNKDFFVTVVGNIYDTPEIIKGWKKPSEESLC